MTTTGVAHSTTGHPIPGWRIPACNLPVLRYVAGHADKPSCPMMMAIAKLALRRQGSQYGVLESVRPHEVRFTHDRISSCLRAGSHSGDVLEIAISGPRAARQVVRGFPPMELVRFPSKKLYSTSSRRLFVFRMLETLGITRSIKAGIYAPSAPQPENAIRRTLRARGDQI